MTAAPPRQILPSLAKAGKGLSEFMFDPQIGEFLNGACTQTALEVCIAAVEGRAPAQASVLRYVQQMRVLKDAAGNPLCGRNGAATLLHTAWYAAHVLHATIATEWDYQEPLKGDWLDLLRANAGVRPILMQVARGAQLIDAETHVRPEAAARGLQYHAIAIIGKQSDGYIVADGDNPQVTQRFQVYDRATLAAAVPCGLLMLAMPTPKPPVPAPPPHPLPPPVVRPIRTPVPASDAKLRAALRTVATQLSQAQTTISDALK